VCECLCVFYNGGEMGNSMSAVIYLCVCVRVCVCVCVCVCVWWGEFDSSLGLLSGKNATLLIHEATLEDGMEEDACEKRHRYMNTRALQGHSKCF